MYWELKKYEQHRVANQSTYWLVFEILWRDFFRFSSIKWGTTMFKLTGPRQQPITEHWTRDEVRAPRWSPSGRPITPWPFSPWSGRGAKAGRATRSWTQT